MLILTAAKKTFSNNGEHNYHALHDTGAALANIMLEAAALGLQAHGMAGFDHEKARHQLGIPADYELGAAVAIGYPGPASSLPENLRERELEPRKRKPLSALAFHGRWDEPLPQAG